MKAFPEAGPAVRVSIDGGRLPQWDPHGEKPALFFQHDGAERTVYRTELEPGGTPRVGQPEPILTVGTDTQVIVGPEPGRFLLVRESRSGADRLGVITDWPAEVAALFDGG